MSIQKSREMLSREEIVEILKTNADLFKREPQFADYIVDLALYLIEFHYADLIRRQKEVRAAHGNETSFEEEPPIVPEELKKPEQDALATRYRILRTASQVGEMLKCVVCGTQVAKKGKCPNCGAMVL